MFSFEFFNQRLIRKSRRINYVRTQLKVIINRRNNVMQTETLVVQFCFYETQKERSESKRFLLIKP